MDENEKKVLIGFLNKISGSDSDTRLEMLNIINEGVDADLMSKILSVCDGQKTGTVFSTLAFALAHELYCVSTSEKELCYITQSYSEYIHASGHSLWVENGSPNAKPADASVH